MKRVSIFILPVLIVGTAACGAAEKKMPAEGAVPAKAEEASKATEPKTAEDERYGALAKDYRDLLRELDSSNRWLIDAWVETRDALHEQDSLDLVWGDKAREAAEKRKEKLARGIPRSKASFLSRLEKEIKSVDNVMSKNQRASEKLTSRKPAGESLQERRRKELETLAKQASQYEEQRDLLSAMEKSIVGYRPGRGSSDRLSQIGISKHHDTGIRKNIREYSDIIDAAFEIKDHQTDIQTLEEKKKAGTDWTYRDGSVLRSAMVKLEKAGGKIGKIAERKKKDLNRDIGKLKSEIDRLNKKIESYPDGSSSRDRYSEKKWELETDLLTLESALNLVVKLADWKGEEKEVEEKKGEEKNGEEKKAKE
ncbi:MAG: hypothetical protein QGH15_19550 [Kiritimatiellia bacterium]|nr:hypothetical protein [Kiritimatiellia bacterium]